MKNPRRMNIMWLHDLVLLAAETERRLPSARLKSYSSYWPEFKQDWGAYKSEKTQIKMDKATSIEISEYDWLKPKLIALETNDRELIWDVASSAAFRSRGPAWSRLARKYDCDRRKVKDNYLKSLMILLQICKKDQKKRTFFHWF